MIQTYMPEEFSIITAKEQNYEKFYNTEIIMREKLNYPPFCDIIVAVVSSNDEKRAKEAINTLYGILKEHFESYEPRVAPIAKINNEYRWRILIKENLTETKNELLSDCITKFLLKKYDVKLSVDVNPNNMM